MDERTFPALDTHELAWAAGFFDGEGNIRVKPNRHHPRVRYYAVIYMPQIDPQVLERFRCAVGGIGNVKGPYDRSRYGENLQPQWHYEVFSFERVQAVVAMLWKWLSPVKREQASAVLAEMKVRLPGNVHGDSPAVINAAKTHCIRGRPFDETNTFIDHRGNRGLPDVQAGLLPPGQAAEEGHDRHHQRADRRPCGRTLTGTSPCGHTEPPPAAW